MNVKNQLGKFVSAIREQQAFRKLSLRTKSLCHVVRQIHCNTHVYKGIYRDTTEYKNYTKRKQQTTLFHLKFHSRI